jgi:hypothetical protein
VSIQPKPFLDAPPFTQPGVPSSSAAWEEHEHVAPRLDAEAQKLLDAAGSPEIAKHAIDAAARQREEMEEMSEAREDLVHVWGFASWDEMLTLSTSVEDSNGDRWWITPCAQQGWMIWNQRDRQLPELFASFEEAHRHLLHRSTEK